MTWHGIIHRVFYTVSFNNLICNCLCFQIVCVFSIGY